MTTDNRKRRIHPAWWTAILMAFVTGIVSLSLMLFNGSLRPFVPVTVTSDRAGLVMENGARVKMRGVQVGQVAAVEGGEESIRLELQIYPDQAKHIPVNVQAEIRATTLFGAKYIDLIPPPKPSPNRLSAGTVIRSRNVTTEVNTVFQQLTNVLHRISPQKLNAVLSALSEGVRGQGEQLGQAISDGNQVLIALNPRAEAMRADWQAVTGFAHTYGAAAHNIDSALDAASTISSTITEQSSDVDSLLTNVIGFSQSGIELLGPNNTNLIEAINTAQPTTSLLMKYNPELTCLLLGGKKVLDDGFGDIVGGANGKSLIIDAAIMLGDDPYRFPDNLPTIAAKGGPDGKPGCGSLPDVSANWPHRQLITNTGWGTGIDLRPNPGIGFPGYANYFPVTRAVPEPPSIRNHGGPAPGPVPYTGAPPYGAPLYGPGGVPLYPGLPPATVPNQPDQPDAPSDAEAFVVAPDQVEQYPPPLAIATPEGGSR